MSDFVIKGQKVFLGRELEAESASLWICESKIFKVGAFS